MARVGIIGAGAMGLAAGYHALKAGHEVVVLEAGPIPGGMAAHFDFGGLSIERFYHFVCKSDRDTFELLEELGLGDAMRWVPTSMGYYVGGRLHDWGDPIALLKFPELSLLAKLRYGLMMFLATKRREPGALENVSARDWIESWCGKATYERLWRPLFDLKFHEYADDISAAWIWTRLKRVGTSRRSLFQEELGHIDGGSETLVTALVEAIEARGGEVRCGAPVERVTVEDGRVTGVLSAGRPEVFDFVICTVPTPYVPSMIPDLPPALRASYEAIQNIGVVCLILKLARSVTPHFWVNTCDSEIPVPGFVEFSNLRATGQSIVYVPYYMPAEHAAFSRPDDAFVEEAYGVLRRVNPALRDDDLLDSRVGRLRHAQPVCPPGFAAMIPPVQTPIAGLQIADTCFYYPEDRGISESVRLGREMAEALT